MPNDQRAEATVLTRNNNAESVGQFQPRVALWQPWVKTHPNLFQDATLKGLRRRPSSLNPVATPSELRSDKCALFTQGFKANPGLKLANAFSVIAGVARAQPWAEIVEGFQRYCCALKLSVGFCIFHRLNTSFRKRTCPPLRRGTSALSKRRLENFSDGFFPGLPKRNPGLKLANAFSVKAALPRLTCRSGRAAIAASRSIQLNISPATAENY